MTPSASLIRRGIKFVIVGGAAFLVYLAVMWAVVDQAHQSLPLGALLAFTCATCVSFVGNSLWAFRVPFSAGSAVRFTTVVGAGLVANLALASLLGHWGFNFAVISVVVFVSVPILNFIGHHFWTFPTSSKIEQQADPIVAPELRRETGRKMETPL